MQWLRQGTAVVRCWPAAWGPAWAVDAPQSGAAAASSAPAPAAYSPQGADTCLACHGGDTNLMGIFRTKHARPNDANGPFGHGGLQCEACHGPGGAHVAAGGGPLAGMRDFGPKALTPAPQQNAVCLGCHQSKRGARLGLERACRKRCGLRELP